MVESRIILVPYSSGNCEFVQTGTRVSSSDERQIEFRIPEAGSARDVKGGIVIRVLTRIVEAVVSEAGSNCEAGVPSRQVEQRTFGPRLQSRDFVEVSALR